MNDRTNNKTKISFQVAWTPQFRWTGLVHISCLFGLCNTMSEITIRNGAKEIWSQEFLNQRINANQRGSTT